MFTDNFKFVDLLPSRVEQPAEANSRRAVVRDDLPRPETDDGRVDDVFNAPIDPDFDCNRKKDAIHSSYIDSSFKGFRTRGIITVSVGYLGSDNLVTMNGDI